MFLKNFNKFRLVFLLLICLKSNAVLAEIIKPNLKIKPMKVIEIQLDSLKRNDYPSKDNGIAQTWEFAHPNNQKYTGPIERFKNMIKGETYSMLLNHSQHKITNIYIDSGLAIFDVVILDENKNYFKFKWHVEKYFKDGPLKNCWLTTLVSSPEQLGSSI